MREPPATTGELLLQSLLRKRLGLEPTTLPHGGTLGLVRPRMEALGITCPMAYACLIESDTTEFEHLVEAAVVRETWFFRDVAPMKCLRDFVRSKWLPAHPHGVLRVLSLPCSTGEEPYSLAITLLEMGVPAPRIAMHGVDISQQALAVAAIGAYDAGSFREQMPELAALRERWFCHKGNVWQAADELRGVVRFRRGNLIDPLLPTGEAPWDVIFCRNLLIYLNTEARRVAMHNLHRLLHPHGLLYVGHTEAAVVDTAQFANYSLEYPCAFRPSQPLQAAAPRASRVSALTSDAKPQSHSLAAARAAANAGRLEEALRLCLDVLHAQGPRADAFCLLGVIRQSQRDLPAAVRCFEQALYLDPHCQDALVHLALLCERQGDSARASHYRRRAQSSSEQ